MVEERKKTLTEPAAEMILQHLMSILCINNRTNDAYPDHHAASLDPRIHA